MLVLDYLQAQSYLKGYKFQRFTIDEKPKLRVKWENNQKKKASESLGGHMFIDVVPPGLVNKVKEYGYILNQYIYG
ncbi:hypothetical protein FVB32_05525 [Flagellimonas hymeniacidonis]|uniref:Uncharacterized protein n=1 Tax=Flagellimonas hymeniacidonis TaxID=2603628 RepID=A0A5C8V979_9FLAO|nr:hypothetical protein FVB32_05525 [Flagellimonas hymeniacidonis]